jgi:superfamily II DNA or RNA helicase
VRRTLRRAAKAQARAEALVAVVARVRADVVAAFEAARERQVLAATDAMPIETIKDVTEGRVPLNGLTEQGYATVGDILRAGRHALDEVPGVGEATARRLVGAAQQLQAAARESVRFRIDLDPTNAENTRLLQALAVWGALQRRIGPSRPGSAATIEEQAGQLAAELAADRPVAVAAGRLRRLFVGRRRRRAADEAAARIADRLRGAETGGLLVAAKNLRTGKPPSAAQVWRDFERRSAEYYGMLGEVVPLTGDVAAAEGYLPAEIVERVNAQRLDTTRLRDSLRLRGYQSFGARFALVQRRVILGDEMGLGKTVQAIAAMAHLAVGDRMDAPAGAGNPTGARLFLVVCPASVLINWTREVEKHSTLPVTALHGAERAKAATRWRRRGGVAVTTFGSLATLVRTPPKLAMLVVDEAHYVKNPDAKRTRAVRRLAAAADRVLFLSGTPMENRIEEFQSLAGHLQPEAAATMGRGHGALGVRAFRRAAAPVYLRRNQNDVLTELPELVQVDEWERFGPVDGAVYQAAVAEGNFMAMRTAAFAVTSPRDSAKLRRLLEIAGEAMVNGHKVVVFSYFRDVLATVTTALGRHAYGPITGSTSTTERQRLIDTFTKVTEPGVLVAQIEAGGVGLNIQAASVVVLCEPQVKPSTEAQAIARAHRMGQVRTVQVHRLLTEDSVDERLLELLDTKAALFDAYVRRSAIAEAAPGAVDISEVALARTIVEQEKRRLSPAA